MGGKRKKSKPSATGPETVNPAEQNQDGQTQSSSSNAGPSRAITTTATDGKTAPEASAATPQTPTPNRSSWYGSWRSSSKALPATAQIAKESISVAQGATSSASEDQPVRPPSSVSKSVRGSRKSIPLAAEATRVHATSDSSDMSRPRVSSSEKDREKEKEKANSGKEEQSAEVVVEEARLPPVPASVDGAADSGKTQSGTWFAWWSRPDGYGSDGEKKNKRLKMDVEQEDATSTPLPGTPNEEGVDKRTKNAMEFEGLNAASGGENGKAGQPEMKSVQSSRGWFGLWSSTQNQEAAESQQTAKEDVQKQQPPEIAVSADPQTTEAAAAETHVPKQGDLKDAQSAAKSSGWAFWSTDKSKEDPPPTPGGTQKQIGELAVADTPSQSHPEAAQFNEHETKQATAATRPSRTGSLLRPKRGKPRKDTPASDSSSAPTPLAGSSRAQTPTSEVSTPSSTPAPEQSAVSSSLSKTLDQNKTLSTKQERPNHILPSFNATFPLAPNPTYMERLTSYLAQSLRLPGAQPDPSPQHVFRSTSPPKIRKAVALGVHGFFPSPLIQKFIGQPKGTSVRFANYAATAVKTWCEQHQPDLKTVEIEKVALEGEGYIADRVTTLWKLLLNWLSHLRQADFILVACHSQGVPVAMMLVAKLIQLGCLAPNARVGICAMAGINLGPFLEYRSRFFGGSALELFEFGDQKSTVSRAYAESLELCLRHGVRVTFAGSIDDQLVSLESSLHTPLHHPYVNRAVFIDGRLHAPNFLTHLVVFAAKLRNLGVSDHGLIRELSAPLAGSLVGGEGHSRVYDDSAVYQLAIEFALESTDVHSDTSPKPSQPDKAKTSTRGSSGDLAGTLPTSPALAQHLRRSSVAMTSGSNLLAPSANSIAPVTTPYEPPPSSTTANPFYLPWAVRGMLEEEMVKKDEGLREEVRQLVREFEEWKPTSKVLRDVRWRLEGVRGMV
ncbi:uncharacterized protein LTR77_007148 [Saxophila tyrrhenica]|uniref:YMC020W-like alpha/beta hydrolase domain-containing protein n=1 Tax=Saxophila tyrrhenica TaxID=1690608 RepID=A0AAV9P6U4_9PEZI|nr:hypothetical protein LTR77_007148 [Saxophila tyrrhenica]